MRANTKENLERMTPEQAYETLAEGNKRFVNNSKKERDLLQQMSETAGGQHPFAVVLSCMDSRTSVELIFDQGLGDVFSLRVAGNIVNEDILGSMEYACGVVGSKLVVVLGHTRCGAIKGACDDVKLGNLTGLLEKIRPVIEESGAPGDGDRSEYVEKVASANVLHGINEILDKSQIIRDLYEKGKIGIVGGIYHVENGQVDFIKEMFNNKSNLSLSEREDQHA